MIIIDIDCIDFTPIFTDGCQDIDGIMCRGNKFAKIATKLFLGADLSTYEKEMMENARDFCISESVKDEIRFK